VTVTQPAPPPPPQANPAITIQKNPDAQTVSVGGVATFRITVTNNGDVALRNVTVTDQLAPGCNRRLGTLAAGASRTYTCTRPGVRSAFTNVAVAVGTPPSGPRVTDRDNAPVRVAAPLQPPARPAIQIRKNPNSQTVQEGGTARFRITVRNTGETRLVGVRVTDPLASRCNRVIGALAAGQSRTYSCTRPNVARSFLNRANVVGTAPNGQRVRDSDTAAVSTAKPAFTG
jgi:uncharacterized repeat protein (TIGR01451 family)